jgi:novel plant SNARE|eukprot:8638-Heterococcus_DN1.PRE.3
MGDVKYWDTSYGKALDELDALVKGANSSSGADREQKLTTAAQTIRRLQGMKRSYNLEIKLMRDVAQKALYQEEKNTKDSRLADYETQLDDIRSKGSGTERNTLFSGRSPEPQQKQKTPEQKLDQAELIQNKTEAKYKNMITVLEQTEEVGSATAATLQDQRDQINDITEGVMEIDSMLTRADKLVRIFSRRLATDKFIQCFGFLNVAALVAIIVYVAIKKVGLPGSKGSAAPPSPVAAT